MRTTTFGQTRRDNGHFRMATTPEDKATAMYPDLALRVIAPRVPRDLPARPRLASDSTLLGAAPIVLLKAPAGFGKTSLLAQWRLEHLSRGLAVAWLTANETDTPLRLLRALALAVRFATGRSLFAEHLFSDDNDGGLSELAATLAELSHLAVTTVPATSPNAHCALIVKLPMFGVK